MFQERMETAMKMVQLGMWFISSLQDIDS
jgi:hypothetical protein